MTGDWVIFLLISTVVLGYLGSLRINPWVKCSRCNGKPQSKGKVFGYAHHFCTKCCERLCFRVFRFSCHCFHFVAMCQQMPSRSATLATSCASHENNLLLLIHIRCLQIYLQVDVSTEQKMHH